MKNITLKRDRIGSDWCPRTIVIECKLNTLQSLLSKCESIEGEVWECGVYNGGSAVVILNNTNKTTRLFDSWEGLPLPSKKDGDTFYEGQFNDTNFEKIKAYFDTIPDVHIHRGWIPESFKGLEDSVISFAHIDLDLYQSYIDALNFIYPRLAIGGIMVFDDYNHPDCQGANKAVDEFFENTPCVVRIEPPTSLGSAYIKKEGL